MRNRLFAFLAAAVMSAFAHAGESGKVTYSAAANTSTSDRTATIKVTSRGLTRICTIKQKGK